MAERKRPAPHAAGVAPPKPPAPRQRQTSQQILKTKGFLAASAAVQEAKQRALHDHIVEQARIEAGNEARRHAYVPPHQNLLQKGEGAASHAAAAGIGHIPIGKTGRKFIQGAADTAVYLPSGLYALRPGHTGKALEQMGRSLVSQAGRTAQHPLREFQSDPWGVSMLGLSALSGGASVGGRLANASRASTASERAAALLRSPRGGSRIIYNTKGEPTTALNFDSPLGRPIAAASDRMLGLNKPGRSILPTGKLRDIKWRSEHAQNQRAMDSLLPQQELKIQSRSKPARVTRLINRVQRFLMLYARPGGYLGSNIPSQELMSLAHQGPRMIQNRMIAAELRGTATGRAYHGLGGRVGRLSKTDRAAFEGGAGAGRTVSTFSDAPPGLLSKAEGLFGTLDERVGRGLGKIVDDPYRTAALVHELRRRGVKPQQIEQTIRDAREFARNRNTRGAQVQGQMELGSGHPNLERASQIMTEATRRTNRAMIDYGRLGKHERGMLRDFLFLYPWVKGSFQYTGRFPFEHPYQTAAATQIADYGKAHTGLPLRQPSIAQGSFKIGQRNVPGLGKVPMVINPRYAGVFTQPLDTTRSALALAPGLTGVQPSRYNDPTDVLLPALSSLIRAGGPEGFKGKEFLAGLQQSIPLINLYKGIQHPPQENPTSRLYPRSFSDVLKQYGIGSLAPKPQNPVSAQSIFRTEKRLGKTKVQQARLSEQWLREDVLKKLQIDQPGLKKNNDFVIQAAGDARRHTEMRVKLLKQYPQFADRLKRGRLTKKGEFVAAVQTLLPDTPVGRTQAKEFADAILTIPDIAFQSSAYRKEHNLKTPSIETVTQLRKLIKGLNLTTSGLPYAEGGNPISVTR